MNLYSTYVHTDLDVLVDVYQHVFVIHAHVDVHGHGHLYGHGQYGHGLSHDRNIDIDTNAGLDIQAADKATLSVRFENIESMKRLCNFEILYLSDEATLSLPNIKF